ncbi:MAG: FG-GAP-like repeat-containing protein [Verrucomicrobiia bacterium]
MLPSLVNHSLIWAASILAPLLIGTLARAAASGGSAGEGFRSAPLKIRESGRPGFTLASAQQTGVRFTNVLDEAASAANRVLENGSGVAIGDADRDGRPDIFLCSLAGKNRFFRNLGGWKFQDHTAAAGFADLPFPCRGAVFADITGDGWLDLLISTLGHGVVCLVNSGDGRFTDTTRAAGTETRSGSMTLALADIDGNGTLDLYVANYRADDIRDRARIDIQRIGGQVVVAPWLRDRLVLGKHGLIEFGEPDALYLNDGRGRFTAVSWTDGRFRNEEGAPLANPPADWGLTATFRDLNGDQLPDLYVCNDYWTPDRIWMNTGQGQFKAIPRLAIRHTSENSMGVDFADIDRDGHIDGLVLDMLSRDPRMRRHQVLAQAKMLAPAAIEITGRPQIMRNTLLRNRGDNTFEEIADFAGVFASDWSWQPVFLDVDLDGFDDILIPAGHRRDVQDLDATLLIQSLQRPWPRGMDAKAHQEAFTRQMMEHSRLYPPLEMPIVTFRNLGNLRFEEMTSRWGTSDRAVHQGIALGDLDGDGDLDFVVNNLNTVCGIYQNECTAPRIAVRLNGAAPNTQGIGAIVTLEGGAVPVQTQEMVCGGRFLSGFEPMLVFATGSAKTDMTLRVRWRSGTEQVIRAVESNRLYEIDEPTRESAPPRSAIPLANQAAQAPLFEDVSQHLRHSHVEDEFDDFARQPLLPRKLSRLGPGLAWHDLNGDGHEDLVVGSGRGGKMALWYGDGQGSFHSATNATASPAVSRDQAGLVVLSTAGKHSSILAGSSNYEDGLATGVMVQPFDRDGKPTEGGVPATLSSAGPLALADYDGDGDLDLFVGGRVIPGRYPEPASSRLYHQRDGHWHLDDVNSRLFDRVGLVSGAVWGDLAGDGFPELILACEWGPIRVLKNAAGRLTEVTEALGFAAHTGWWSGVTTGDFNEDGRLDIAAANWGLNSPHRASASQPLQLVFGSFTGRGTVDIIETEFDLLRRCVAPRHRLDFMAAALPFLRERYSSFKAFSEATLDQVLTHMYAPHFELAVRTLASTVFINGGDRFSARPLPTAAQLAPAHAVSVADYNGDGHEDVFLSQNSFDLQWETPRQDAGRGLILLGAGSGDFQAMPGQSSGILVYGQQRGAAIADFNEDGRVDLVVAQNGAETRLFLNREARPGLRVRLRGTEANPLGIGAVVRVRFGERWGPAREVHAGSGYWSQDSAVQVMGTPEPPVEVQVNWPGGKVTRSPIPESVLAIAVHHSGRVDPAQN